MSQLQRIGRKWESGVASNKSKKLCDKIILKNILFETLGYVLHIKNILVLSEFTQRVLFKDRKLGVSKKTLVIDINLHRIYI